MHNHEEELALANLRLRAEIEEFESHLYKGVNDKLHKNDVFKVGLRSGCYAKRGMFSLFGEQIRRGRKR